MLFAVTTWPDVVSYALTVVCVCFIMWCLTRNPE